jgi:hypothetical protein
MHNQRSLATLFEHKPATWNLRGDPHLWREMKELFEGHAQPDTEEALMALLTQTFEPLIGVALTEQGPVFVERYNHGGMTSGSVSPPFWAEKVFPLLLARYREARQATNDAC